MMLKNMLKSIFLKLPVSDIRKVQFLAYVNPPKYPRNLIFEPTIKCNLKCVMCGGVYWKRPPKKNMDFQMFKKILSQVPVPPLEQVTLQGLGEPLLNRDLIKMVEFARSLGLYTRFNSNLLLLTEEMATKLVECKHSEINISTETFNSDIYASIRKGGSLEKLLENIHMINEIKAKKNSEYPMLALHVVLMKLTADSLVDIVRKAKDLGIFRVSFADMNTDGLDLSVKMIDGSRLGDNTFTSLPKEKIESIFKELKSFETKDFQILLPEDWGGGMKPVEDVEPRFLTCRELWEEPYITCDGFMTPCCFKPDQSLFNMGNFSESSFYEIWFGEAYQNLRKQHLLNNHPKECKNCQQLHWRTLPDTKSNSHYLKYFLGSRPFSNKSKSRL